MYVIYSYRISFYTTENNSSSYSTFCSMNFAIQQYLKKSKFKISFDQNTKQIKNPS